MHASELLDNSLHSDDSHVKWASCFSGVLLQTYQVTETEIEDKCAKYLKYAPERIGGGGRK